MAAMVRTRMPRIFPAPSKAISASVTWSRPCGSLTKVSVRPARHFTGWPSFLAAHSTIALSGNSLPRRPKPPPTSGEITRSCSFGTRKTNFARPSRTRTTPCVGE